MQAQWEHGERVQGKKLGRTLQGTVQRGMRGREGSRGVRQNEEDERQHAGGGPQMQAWDFKKKNQGHQEYVYIPATASNLDLPRNIFPPPRDLLGCVVMHGARHALWLGAPSSGLGVQTRMRRRLVAAAICQHPASDPPLLVHQPHFPPRSSCKRAGGCG